MIVVNNQIILVKCFLDYNLGPNADFEAKEITSNETNTTENSSLLTNSTNIDNSSISGRFNNISMRNDYENDNVLQQIHENIEADKSYTNLPTVNEQQRPLPAQRPSKSSTILQPTKPTGAIKKIPENLKLRSDDKINNNNHSDYRASGPYIPLSDCFSGSPVLFVSTRIILKLSGFNTFSLLTKRKAKETRKPRSIP